MFGAAPSVIASSGAISWSGGGDAGSPAGEIQISLRDLTGGQAGFLRVAGGEWVSGPVTVAAAETFEIGVLTGPVPDGAIATLRFATPDREYAFTAHLRDEAPDAATVSLDPAQPGMAVALDAFTPTGFDTPVSLTGEVGLAADTLLVSVDGAAPQDLSAAALEIQPGSSLQFFMDAGDPGQELFHTVALGLSEIRVETVGGLVAADAFVIPAIMDAAPAIETLSEMVRPTGFTVPVAISVSRVGSAPGEADPEIVLEDGQRGVALTIQPGQGFRVAMISGPDTGALRQADVALGGSSAAGLSSPVAPSVARWTLVAPDVTPDDPGFGVTAGHEPDSFAETDSFPITGISAPVFVRPITQDVEISINGGPWVAFGDVTPFSTLALRRPIPFEALFGDGFDAEIAFGLRSGADTIETPTLVADWRAEAAGVDFQPDPFTVADVLDAEPNADRLSAPVSLSGYDRAARIAVVGTGASVGVAAKIAVGDADAVLSTEENPVTIRPGQSFRVEAPAGDFGDSRTFEIRVGRVFGGDPSFTAAPWILQTRVLDAAPSANYIVPDITIAQRYLAKAESQTLAPTGFMEPADIVITGALAGVTEARVNGGTWTAPDGSGVAGTVLPGQTFQLRHTVETADGADRAVTVKIGDTAPYVWTIATLDMIPDGALLPQMADQTLNSTAFSQRAKDIGGAWWVGEISGLGEGASITTPSGIRRYSTRSDAENNLNSSFPATLSNGDFITLFFTAKPGESRRISMDFGSVVRAFDLTVITVASQPLDTVFLNVNDAMPNTRSYSPWQPVRAFGAPMVVDVTDAGSHASAKLQVWSFGQPEPAKGVGEARSVTMYPNPSNTNLVGDMIRVAVDQGADILRQATVQFRSSPNQGTVWSSRTSIGDIKPNAFFVGAPGPIQVDIARNSIAAVLGHNFFEFGGFDTAITVSATVENVVTRGSLFADTFRATPDNTNRRTSMGDPIQLIPGRGGSRVLLSGYAAPGSVRRVTLTAGHPTDANQQVVRDFLVRIDDEDRMPSVAAFPANVIAPTPGQSTTSGAAIVTGLSSSGRITARVEGVGLASGVGLRVNAGGFTTGRASVNNGDSLFVRVDSGPAGESRTVNLIVEGFDTNGVQSDVVVPLTVTTVDDVPDAIEFIDLENVQIGAWVRSNEITIAGLDAPTAFGVLSLTGGQALAEINGSGARVSSGSISNGDTVRLWMRTTTDYATANTARLSVGGAYQSEWTVVTRAEDTTPNAFGFPAVSQAPQGEIIVSSVVFPSGFADEAPVAIVTATPGLEISVAGGAFSPTPTPASIFPGQAVRLRMTGPGLNESVTATVAIGGVEGSWTVSGAVE